jgi:hypothetical protein
MPITWPCTQHAAARLIRRAWTPPPAKESFEYRATGDVLALTILLTSFMAPVKEDWGGRLCMMKAVLECDVEWALWCSSHLAQAPAHLSVTDLGAASSAWAWLTRSRLLAGGLSRRFDACAGTAAYPGAALSIGVALARRTCVQPVSAIPLPQSGK